MNKNLPFSTNLKNSSSPKDIKRTLSMPNERDLNSDFSLPFRDIYDYHIKEIEKRTNIKIKYIYISLSSFFIFFDRSFRKNFFIYNNRLFSYHMDKRRLQSKKRLFLEKMGNILDYIFLLNIFRYPQKRSS